MSEVIKFTVYGKPQSAGSKRAIPIHVHGVPLVKNGRQVTRAIDDNPRSKDWKNTIAYTVRQEYRGDQLTGPISLVLRFYQERPKNHYRTGRNAHLLKDDAPDFPTGKPDVLKLARGAEDALTQAGLWGDDAQIVHETLTKEYGKPRVEIEVSRFVTPMQIQA